MAKKATVPFATITPELSQSLLAMFKSSEKPLSASDLTGLMPEGLRFRPADLQGVIQDYLTTGQLFEYPPKTAKAKPQYWHHHPEQFIDTHIVKYLRGLVHPASVKEVLSGLSLPFKLKADSLSGPLDRLVTTNQAYLFPPATKSGQPRYWHSSLLDYVCHAIPIAISRSGPLSEVQLRTVAKGFPAAIYDQGLQELERSRVLFRHPPIGKKGALRFGLQPPVPDPYLAEVETLLTQVLDRLRLAGVSEEALSIALMKLVRSVGLPVPSPGVFSAVMPSTAGHQDQGHLSRSDSSAHTGSALTETIIQLMHQLDAGAAHGALIGARELRRAAKLDKPVLDAAVLQMSREGIVSVHRHDYPNSLSDAERSELITDGQQNFFVGVALRSKRT